ncbi:hypothetical protein SAMN04488128_1021031 [Chitinophaga eiseniae]|uniref:Uncharacterized protein n=1 Tax=Chitinophaga eiseniae TaxID=634771 RepID=A0A1T4RCJ2_9BACT|nr:hypothetical protein [Chitinophaga eiseniae]SKA13762.1 hypothetical protein SAMN04488128_1021031 [Chitinophaga eiseniae]
MSIKAKYFFIAVIIMGSIGIWLPIILEAIIEKKVTFHNVPPNVTTYFVSLLFAGCIDLILGKINKLNINGLVNVILNILFILLLGLGIVVGAILLNIYKYDFWALLLGIVGLLISYRIWWIANDGNPNFSNTAAPLGGDVNRPLANG